MLDLISVINGGTDVSNMLDEYPLEYVKFGCAGKSLSISVFSRG